MIGYLTDRYLDILECSMYCEIRDPQYIVTILKLENQISTYDVKSPGFPLILPSKLLCNYYVTYVLPTVNEVNIKIPENIYFIYKCGKP